jgi:hypothetical protein
MQATPLPTGSSFSQNIFFLVIAIIVAAAAGLIASSIFSRMNTVPSGLNHEGFQGPAVGVSDISCGQESAEARALIELFYNKQSTTEEGNPDLKELKQIVSKLCCMKRDLMGVSQVVQNILYIPYNNTHDRENPADTVARCFTKSIPARDLDITFGTWKQRGLVLINKLCTSYNVSSSETEKATQLFTGLWTDVFSIAKNACLTSPGSENVSPRDLKGHVPESVDELGPYIGYY